MKGDGGFGNMTKYHTIACRIVIFVNLVISGVAVDTARADPNTAARFADYVYGVKPMTFGSGLAAGIEEFTGLVNSEPTNGEAVFGLGALHFLRAVEEFKQDLYRYGAVSPFKRRFIPFLTGGFEVNIPINPNPEVLSYEKFRQMLQRFSDRMQLAVDALEKLNPLEAKLSIEPLNIGMDINADGSISNEEYFLRRFSKKRRYRKPKFNFQTGQKIVFDVADAKWLQGYSLFLMSTPNFFLSFDFKRSYDVAFHTFFGNSATEFGRQLNSHQPNTYQTEKLLQEMQDLETRRQEVFSQEDRSRLNYLNEFRNEVRRDKTMSKQEKELSMVDVRDEMKDLRSKSSESNSLRKRISALQSNLPNNHPKNRANFLENYISSINFIHTFDWPIVDSHRFQKVRTDLQKTIELSLESWRLTALEVDDDHEWIPNAAQTSPFSNLSVTQKGIDDWVAFLADMKKVLKGELLIPHTFIGRNINLRKFFETATKLDLVLFLTGPNAIQFSETGPEWSVLSYNRHQKKSLRDIGKLLFWYN